MEQSRDTQSIPFMVSLRIITKIASPSSWTSPNPISRADGPGAATLESSTGTEEISAQIFLNKICTDTYRKCYEDHIKLSLPSWTHLSVEIWVQKSRTIVFELCWIAESGWEKRQLCTSLVNYWLDLLYCECGGLSRHFKCQFGKKCVSYFKGPQAWLWKWEIKDLQCGWEDISEFIEA